MSKKTNKTLSENNNYKFYANLVFQLENKYYNLFRSNWKWNGLTYQEEKFVMDSLWDFGTIACFKIANTDMLGYTRYATILKDMYGQEAQVRLTNLYNSPVVPSKDCVVGKDVELGFLTSSHKGLRSVVKWYIERIAQCEMLINTQMNLHKMPYLIPIQDDNEKRKIEDVVDRILNNEVSIYIEGVNPNIFQAVNTHVDYIIDKIYLQEQNYINELKSIMGIMNAGTNKIEQIQMVEATSNQTEITSYEFDMTKNLNDFCERVNKTFGGNISVERVVENDTMKGQVHENEEKTGSKDYLMEEGE